MHESGVSARERSETAEGTFPVVGNWQLGPQIQAGKDIVVHRARPAQAPPSSPMDYAIKLATSPPDRQPEIAWQLHREVKIARQVAHEHLISVLDAHLQQPPYFFVMPFLDAVTLRQCENQTHSLNLPWMLWVFRQTAEALAALHCHQWSHRDLKPDNIMVSGDGHVTLIDLGFVESTVKQKSHDKPFAGTLEYSCPEAFCASMPLTAAGDIYSLGVVMFERLCGQLPFAADNPEMLALSHLRQVPPDVRQIRPQLPSRLARLLRRMLSKDPLRRPEAAELVTTLISLEIETFDHREAA